MATYELTKEEAQVIEKRRKENRACQWCGKKFKNIKQHKCKVEADARLGVLEETRQALGLTKPLEITTNDRRIPHAIRNGYGLTFANDSWTLGENGVAGKSGDVWLAYADHMLAILVRFHDEEGFHEEEALVVLDTRDPSFSFKNLHQKMAKMLADGARDSSSLGYEDRVDSWETQEGYGVPVSIDIETKYKIKVKVGNKKATA